MRFILNLAILLVEAGLIAMAAAVAFAYPLVFAGLTAGLVLVTGWQLERARLIFEYPFYLEDKGAGGRGAWGGRCRAGALGVLAMGETFIKALLAGVVALLTFSGVNDERLWLTALVFGATTFLGTSVLRWLSISFGVNPARWGYFRLAIPLGVMFSVGMQMLVAVGLIELKSLQQIASTIVFELPQQPSLPVVSEFLFNVKQTLDALVVEFLKRLIDERYAQVVAMVISLNLLAGLVVGIYAVLIAEVVRRLEIWAG
ncbi:MAG TPA: hypothetical protein VMX97_03125 [Hyphomicrobiaceae bacterium]|nr:hypothetical protein [Hyphomicrobiaceae bacterium]